jgi:hypothetical protein
MSWHKSHKLLTTETEVLLPAIKLTKENVIITIRAEEEDVSPKESYRIPGVKHRKSDVKRYVDAVDDMVRKHGLPWGWCQVTITARYASLSGSAHLGACSYESDEDFEKNSGYYDQMVAEALDELQTNVDGTYRLIHVDL